MSDLNDDITRRLRAANPVPSGRTDLPSGRSIEQLTEETMANATDEPRTRNSMRWRVMAAAAVVAAAGVAGGIYAATSGSDTTHHAKSVLSLKLPKPAGAPHPGRGSACILFTTELLAKQAVAFSGTVDSVANNTVKLRVDHWYKGGTADEVDLATPGYPNAVQEFGVSFETGHRYLVSATGGVVTGCGYTLAYSADSAAEFAKAFGS